MVDHLDLWLRSIRKNGYAVDVPLGLNTIGTADFKEPTTHFPRIQQRGFVGIQERGALDHCPADMAGTELFGP